jgi:hypothetical protein
MNAKEARERSEKAAVSTEGSQYFEIKSKINTVTGEGEYKLLYYKKVKQAVKAKLESEGFTVKDLSDRDGKLVEISW